MKIKDLITTLESLAPSRFAESWDNVGLLIGDEEQCVGKVLLTIDLGTEQLQEAKSLGCEAVIAYHPVIFKGIRRLLAGMTAFEAVRAGISVLSPHTALDVAEAGTNDGLADVLGLVNVRPLRSIEEGVGMGRIGELKPAVDRDELLQQVKTRLGLEHLLVAGPCHGLVEVAAVCAGACGELLDNALNQGAQLYLTGEVRHHDALRAAQAGMTVVCALHSNSERHVLPALRSRLLKALPGLHVFISVKDRDPFAFF